MKLSEIHAAIEAGRGPELPEDLAFATLVAIERLAWIEGIPVSALDFSPPQVGAKYTFQFMALSGSWRGRAQYLSWRNLILNVQLLFVPGNVDADPWASLARADRLWRGVKSARSYGLNTRLPVDTHPRHVTDDLLMSAYSEVLPAEATLFRASLNNFRQLFQNDLALQTGLLPAARPQPLPGIRDQRQRTTMSPEIEGWRSGFVDRTTTFPLEYLHRLAVESHLLNGETDTLDDLRVALCALPDFAELGVSSIQAITHRGYVNLIRRTLGGPDPRKTPAEQAWADLRASARAAGRESNFLWAVSQKAAAQNISPREMTSTIAQELMWSYEDKKMWTQFRQGCEQFDALRTKIPQELLPPSALGIRRAPPRAPKPVVPPDPVKTAWADLYARLHGLGWQKSQLSSLSYLRVRASSANIVPSALSQPFIEKLERDITRVEDRTRLRAAVLSIAALSREPGFRDLPDLTPPAYTKFTHGGPGERARAELDDLMNFMNAAAPTRRAFRVAVGVLTDAMGRTDIPLKDILETDVSAYDLGSHEPQRKYHTDMLRHLRKFLELPWTPAWRELQTVVVGTGIATLNNPVPKVLSWIPNVDPDGLTLEWAQRLDRDLRSTLKNPPHGRADLAKTLARHLAALDALHEIPAVAGSGLLPLRIGPIR